MPFPCLSQWKMYSLLRVLSPPFRKTVVHGGAVIPHPFGISLFEHTVYFTDWTKMAVMKANKFSDTNPQVVYTTSQTPHGVQVVHQLRQPYGKHVTGTTTPLIFPTSECSVSD